MSKKEWQEYLDKCNAILEGDSPDDFGHGFIESVSDWIEEHETVTEKQMGGIDRIYAVYEQRDWL